MTFNTTLLDIDYLLPLLLNVVEREREEQLTYYCRSNLLISIQWLCGGGVKNSESASAAFFSSSDSENRTTYREWNTYLQRVEHTFTANGTYIYREWNTYLQRVEHIHLQRVEHIFTESEHIFTESGTYIYREWNTHLQRVEHTFIESGTHIYSQWNTHLQTVQDTSTEISINRHIITQKPKIVNRYVFFYILELLKSGRIKFSWFSQRSEKMVFICA